MKIILTLIFSIAFTITNAQSIDITGFVNDNNKKPLASASITLMKLPDSTLVKTTVTSSNGSFSFKQLSMGTYEIEITMIGYKSDKIQIEKKSENVNLGIIILQPITTSLEDVKVVAQKPMVQVLADKTVFNVENTINANGSNGWELLRKAPGIIIDNNGGIIVEGKTGVQIYIDGKPSQLRGTDLQAFLETLQSTDINSIEIITQPSSKYDAAGNAGIINIRLKKNKNFGTNGSVTTGVTIGAYPRYNSSLSLNNRTKKGNLYGTYSNSVGKGTNFLYLYRYQNNKTYDARTESIYKYNNDNIRIGYDLFASTKSTFGIIANGNISRNDGKNDSRTPITEIDSAIPDSILIARNTGKSNVNNYNLNLNYRFADTSGHVLNIDVDYGKYNRERSAFQPNFYYNSSETMITSQKITSQETPIDITIATFKTDYEQNLWKGKIAFGIKFSHVQTDNVFDFFNIINNQSIKDNTQSNVFAYTENINAIYFNYNVKKGKWRIQGGLRAENTISDGKLTSTQNNTNNRVKRNYTNLFPSGGLTYEANQKSQLALLFSQRIERPNYSSLNPFEYKIDEISFSRGNPFLQPQYTTNIKLSHTYKYTLNTSLSYSRIRDFFAQITEAEGTQKNFISQQNIANQEVINLGVSYPFKVTKWWNVYLSINAYTSSYKALNPKFVPIKQQTLSLYAQHTIKMPYNIAMEVSGWYSSPSVWGGTYNTKALGALNIGFQKKFLKDKLSSRLSFNDILYTSPWKGTTQFGNLLINGSGGNDSRTVALSITYNFGNDKVKKSRSRKIGSEEESGRVN